MNRSNDPSIQRQHFIPIVYLNRFTNITGKLGIKRISGDRKGEIFTPRPNNIFKEKGLYDITSVFPDVSSLGSLIERTYGKIEGRFDVVMKNTFDIGKNPNEEETKIIVDFAAFQLFRTPTFINLYHERRGDKHKSINNTVTHINTLFMSSFLNSLDDKNRCVFVRFPKRYRLLSSDNPSTIWGEAINGEQVWVHESLKNLDRAAYDKLSTCLRMPLTPNVMCYIESRLPGKNALDFRKGTIQELKMINAMTIRTAKNFLII